MIISQKQKNIYYIPKIQNNSLVFINIVIDIVKQTKITAGVALINLGNIYLKTTCDEEEFCLWY